MTKELEKNAFEFLDRCKPYEIKELVDACDQTSFSENSVVRQFITLCFPELRPTAFFTGLQMMYAPLSKYLYSKIK